MSNKILVLALLGIVIVGAAAAGYYYWQQTKPLVVEQTPTTNNDQQAPSPDAFYNPTKSSSNSPSMSTSTQVTKTDECKNNFSQTQLSANSNIKIANRQVEINVKDFGKIQVELYDKDAPLAVINFLRLVDSGYYNCLTFHRVAKGFVIQGGDPSGNGTGGTSAYGKPFADELSPNTPSAKVGYVKGVLAMANSGANTNGSQFFIMLNDNQLPHLYTIFGKVTLGLDVVDKIGQVEIIPQMGATDGAPKEPVVMTTVKIIK